MRGDDHLRSFLPPSAAQDEELGLPAQGEEYKPHAAPANKPVFAIHFLLPAGRVRTFQYADLDSDSCYEADAIRLRFSGTKVTEVTIRGRALWRLYDGIHRHVIRWVAQASRDFAADGECVVSRIDFTDAVQERPRPSAPAEPRREAVLAD